MKGETEGCAFYVLLMGMNSGQSSLKRGDGNGTSFALNHQVLQGLLMGREPLTEGSMK